MDTRSVAAGVTISPANLYVYIDSNRVTPVNGYTFTFPLTPTLAWSSHFADPVINSRFPPGYQILYTYYKVAQVYTVTVDSAVHDIYGDYFGTSGSFSFTPEPYFRVTDTYPRNNDTAVSRSNPYITIRFNSLIDTISAQSSFTSLSRLQVRTCTMVRGDLPGLSLPALCWRQTEYTVTIGTSIKDVNGNVPPAPYLFSFSTAQ